MPDSSTDGVPSRIAGFRIEEALPSDGAGRLYVAEDERERRRVALRVIPHAIAGDDARRARAIEGARALIGLSHPNLAGVLAVDDAAEGVLIASEPAPGRALRERIESDGRLDLAESLRIATEVASAIATLHRVGRAHGALDDQRVVLDENGSARVTGLGLGEIAEPARATDARDDVRAIGALLRQMLAGSAIPGSVESLIARATDREPSRRFSDADALLAALAAIDLPVDPVAMQAAEMRADVSSGASTLWVVGASIVLAAVIGLAIAIVMGLGR